MNMKKTIRTVAKKVLPRTECAKISAIRQGYNPETLIKKNKKFKNMYDGKRCFILGNGPSLKLIDLKELADEVVFCVNFFNLVQHWEDARPDFHFLMDPNLFGLRKDAVYDHKELIDYYLNMEKFKIEMFVPTRAYPFFVNNGLKDKLKLNYIWTVGDIIEHNNCFDIEKATTPFTTVVQYCIETAVYMGFKEIYLLGCDSTEIYRFLDIIKDGSQKNIHAYEDGKEIKQIIPLNDDLDEILLSNYRLFVGYKKLNRYCEQLGIRLYNCSKPTLITSIPQMNIETVINSDKRSLG